MTSSYSEKITKLKNALENVFVKKTDIQNNLTSTDTNKPLSANQGKVLDTNKVDKISGKNLSTNDFTNTYKTKLDNLDTLLESKASSTHTHGNLQNDGSIGTSNNINKNVITDGNGKITTEDKPTIPIASTGNTYADEGNGSYGSSTNYARADHKHPKSSLYAEASHIHSTSDITNLQTSLNDKIEASDLLELIYPIGSIYMSVNSTSPATLFGGTWVQIKDTFLLACGDTYSSDGDVATAQHGSATVTLTTNQIPSHNHQTGYRQTYGSGNAVGLIAYSSSASAGNLNTSSTGGGKAHNNMPPYMAVYVWKRTA